MLTPYYITFSSSTFIMCLSNVDILLHFIVTGCHRNGPNVDSPWLYHLDSDIGIERNGEVSSMQI